MNKLLYFLLLPPLILMATLASLIVVLLPIGIGIMLELDMPSIVFSQVFWFGYLISLSLYYSGGDNNVPPTIQG